MRTYLEPEENLADLELEVEISGGEGSDEFFTWNSLRVDVLTTLVRMVRQIYSCFGHMCSNEVEAGATRKV